MLEEFQEDDSKVARNTEESQMPSIRARDWLAQCEELTEPYFQLSDYVLYEPG